MNSHHISLERIRKELHRIPEIAGKEKLTSKYLYEILRNFRSLKVQRHMGGAGILVQARGRYDGPHIAFRADIDAIPIHEDNQFPHRSTHEGCMHACGHDGHMAILIGLAHKLVEHPIQKGKVSLIFQAAEETGEGARLFLDSLGKEKNFKADRIYSLHNIPSFPKGQILCKRRSFSSAVISCAIQLKGKSSHASAPQDGINPTYAIARLILKTKELQQADPKAHDFCLITPICTDIGSEAYGTAAGEGSLHLTLRTRSNAKMERLKTQLEQIIKAECFGEKLNYSIQWLEEFKAVENSPNAVIEIERAAQQLHYSYHELENPFNFGEDFGLFTDHYDGAMFGIGAGEEHPQLHSTVYDFPDEIIPVGLNMFMALLDKNY